MSTRPQRVAEAIKRLTSEIVHNQLKDPRLKGFITITNVTVTPDLRHASIYYSVLEDERKKKLITRGLKSAKNFIRKIIGDELELRYTPDISFKIDKTFEYKERIDKILDKIHGEVKNESDKSDNKND